MNRLQRISGFLTLSAMFFSISSPVRAASFLDEARDRAARYEKEVQDLTIEQEMTLSTPEGSMTQNAVARTKGNKFRLDSRMEISGSGIEGMPAMETTVISNGNELWMISPMVGRKQLSPEEGLQYRRDSSFWKLLSNEAKVIREEKLGNYDCVVFEVSENGQPYLLWIEKGTYNLIQAEFSRGLEGRWTWWNSDFRKSAGEWQIPYRTEIFQNEKQVATTIVKSVNVNTGLSDAVFEPQLVTPQGGSMQDLMRQMMQDAG